ncbi:MAG: IS110 family transposase [bacterium]
MTKIQTKKAQVVNNKILLVTIDIGKESNMGYYRFSNNRGAKPFPFGNHAHGFNFFWDRISQVQTQNQLEEIVVGFESTGPYGEPLVHFLKRKGVKLVQVNPMHTKRLKELTGNSPNKTDRKDPKVIADIIELGHALTVIVPEGSAAELRRLTQARERSVRRRTGLLNQLQDLVFLVFPEFLTIIKGVKSKTARYLLNRYSTPGDFVACGDLDLLCSRVKKISRGRIGRERIEPLYLSACSSVGIQEGRESLVLEIRQILSWIELVDGFIAQLEDAMVSHLQQIPYSSSILSIKGVGPITAAGLIGEVGDFGSFRAIPEMEKLAGLDLFEISSGLHKGRRRISKRGRPLLRKLLYFGAINVVRTGGILHGWYHRAIDRGMPKTKALVAVARKLLRIVFAAVRDHREFTYDYMNQPKLRMTA